MANTRKSTKRAKQAKQRQERNTMVRSAARTALKSAIDALKATDEKAAKAAFMNAIKIVSKAASKGAIPKTRAARKISRLTRMIKKAAPAVLAAK
jgi:small subunit ribosomal protein S20